MIEACIGQRITRYRVEVKRVFDSEFDGSSSSKVMYFDAAWDDCDAVRQAHALAGQKDEYGYDYSVRHYVTAVVKEQLCIEQEEILYKRDESRR